MQSVFSVVALVAAAVTFALPAVGITGTPATVRAVHVCPPAC